MMFTRSKLMDFYPSDLRISFSIDELSWWPSAHISRRCACCLNFSPIPHRSKTSFRTRKLDVAEPTAMFSRTRATP